MRDEGRPLRRARARAGAASGRVLLEEVQRPAAGGHEDGAEPGGGRGHGRPPGRGSGTGEDGRGGQREQWDEQTSHAGSSFGQGIGTSRTSWTVVRSATYCGSCARAARASVASTIHQTRWSSNAQEPSGR